LKEVELLDGLVHIYPGAFQECISLEWIDVPSSVKVIGVEAFADCTALAKVELCEGLKKINLAVFRGCTSLEHIKIPSSVDEIHQDAFSNCDILDEVEFCEEIEQVVDVLRDCWWDYGDYGQRLRTCKFLNQHRIPERLGLINARKWRDNIHGMLNAIPSVPFHKADKYYDSLVSQLAVYERLRDAATLVELALWKSALLGLCHSKNADSASRLECRASCCAVIIIPLVISFLLVNGDEDEDATVGKLSVNDQAQRLAMQVSKMVNHAY
jgi:hypothetical protein